MYPHVDHPKVAEDSRSKAPSRASQRGAARPPLSRMRVRSSVGAGAIAAGLAGMASTGVLALALPLAVVGGLAAYMMTNEMPEAASEDDRR